MPVHIPGFDGGDRTALALPDSQSRLLTALAGTGKPLVVVLESGSAIALGKSADRARAILQAWYGGERGGRDNTEELRGGANPPRRMSRDFYTPRHPPS